MGRKAVDLTGQRFGRLVVVNKNEEVSKQKKGVHWNCKCDCGNETVVWGGYLRNGRTQSCGCLNKENASNKIRKFNEKMWQDEEYRQMKSELSSKRLKEKWEDEEFRQMQSELSSKRLKEKWEDEEFRQAKSDEMREMAKQQWQDEEFREMRRELSSKMLKQKWEDEEMKWKMGYKGGISSISGHLRNLNDKWFDNCRKEANYTCQLTGKYGGKLHTHHLYAFSSIVMDAHNTYNIEVKPQVKDYTEEELKLLEEYVAEWHKDGSNAVVLSEEAHMLFHNLYGRGGNTPEQYEEFKQRYINGEFKDLI